MNRPALAINRLIHLQTCSCEHCKGRAAVCMDGFNWIDRGAPNHSLAHAKEDMNRYFDGLPASIKDALNVADVNVCAWCAQIWVAKYGATRAAQLIRDVRFIDEMRAVTPVNGWTSYLGSTHA
jgi:hypothetical protein